MVLTRSKTNERQHQKAPEQRTYPVQEPTTAREVTMDVTEPEPEPSGLPQTYGGLTYGSPISFDSVPLDGFWAIRSIPWFTRTAFDKDVDKNTISYHFFRVTARFTGMLRAKLCWHACGGI